MAFSLTPKPFGSPASTVIRGRGIPDDQRSLYREQNPMYPSNNRTNNITRNYGSDEQSFREDERDYRGVGAANRTLYNNKPPGYRRMNYSTGNNNNREERNYNQDNGGSHYHYYGPETYIPRTAGEQYSEQQKIADDLQMFATFIRSQHEESLHDGNTSNANTTYKPRGRWYDLRIQYRSQLYNVEVQTLTICEARLDEGDIEAGQNFIVSYLIFKGHEELKDAHAKRIVHFYTTPPDGYSKGIPFTEITPLQYIEVRVDPNIKALATPKKGSNKNYSLEQFMRAYNMDDCITKLLQTQGFTAATELLDLNDDELKTIVPGLGYRKKLCAAIQKFREDRKNQQEASKSAETTKQVLKLKLEEQEKQRHYAKLEQEIASLKAIVNSNNKSRSHDRASVPVTSSNRSTGSDNSIIIPATTVAHGSGQVIPKVTVSKRTKKKNATRGRPRARKTVLDYTSSSDEEYGSADNQFDEKRVSNSNNNSSRHSSSSSKKKEDSSSKHLYDEYELQELLRNNKLVASDEEEEEQDVSEEEEEMSEEEQIVSAHTSSAPQGYAIPYAGFGYNGGHATSKQPLNFFDNGTGANPDMDLFQTYNLKKKTHKKKKTRKSKKASASKQVKKKRLSEKKVREADEEESDTVDKHNSSSNSKNSSSSSHSSRSSNDSAVQHETPDGYCVEPGKISRVEQKRNTKMKEDEEEEAAEGEKDEEREEKPNNVERKD